MSNNTDETETRFTRSVPRHRIGSASVRQVMASTEPTLATTHIGTDGWRYIGRDERGRELEIIAIELQPAGAAPSYLLAIPVMPTQLRG